MIFLYFLAFLVTVIAIFQDLKEREVANWLNFSFIAVALGYRAFYSVFKGNWNFFIYGALGFGFMFVLAYVLYYSRAFAGGDAKLLMGLGVVLPFTSVKGVLFLGIVFIFLVFLAGLVWSLLYSVYFIERNWKKFKEELKKGWKVHRWIVSLGIGIAVLSIVVGVGMLWMFFFLLSLLWVYVKALDGAMKFERSAKELREGDWIEEDIRLVGGRVIRKSVHGLSLEDIMRIKKYGKGKKVLIKEGIPFTPAFLGALIVMALFLEVLLSYLSFLF